MSNHQILGYQPGSSPIHRVNATVKLVFLLLVSVAAMTTYDTRFLVATSILSLVIFKVSGIKWRQISFVVKFIAFFTIINIVAVYLFDPSYGVRLYKSNTVLWQGIGRFNLTTQELFYLFNLCLKYICTVPLALVFLLTTHPSHFASSLNKIGVNYKISYAIALALRYIPDIQETYFSISQAQQARGFDMSKKAGLLKRIKGVVNIATPLIFTSIERIDTISTAMEIRQFGTRSKRSWYVSEPFRGYDYIILLFAIIMLVITILLFFVNGSRFYNPWI
ncbi:energy-coupling factor transporter transmembrane component T family protein [Staphylococcus simulans]|uniref:energy-coupling factor transporter transmembrane component T family protein n=1 Tax=Staphylococcus simulans TaxID=1286 RepID=UPI000D032A07|nr:energy-coupling factor transporter transmembrane component T [Staphylococcus simulans]